MHYKTMVKIRFKDEETFESFCDLIRNKFMCPTGCTLVICDNDEDDEDDEK